MNERQAYKERRKDYLRTPSYSLIGERKEVQVSIAKFHGWINVNSSLEESWKELKLCLGEVLKTVEFREYMAMNNLKPTLDECTVDIIHFAKNNGLVPQEVDDHTVFEQYPDWIKGVGTPEYMQKYWSK